MAVARLLQKEPKEIEGVQDIWRKSLVTSPIILTASLILILILDRVNPGGWGLRLPGFQSAFITVVVGFAISAIVTLVQTAIDAEKGGTMEQTISRRDIPSFIVSIVFLSSIAEELIFRGFLQQLVDNTILLATSASGLMITAGGIISAALFALVHAMPAKIMGQSVSIMVIGAFILGVSAAVSLASTASLLAPIIVHMEFNIMGAVWGQSLERDHKEGERQG